MKKTFTSTLARCALGCSTLGLMSTGVAFADDSGLALEEITVTAQKREQSLQDVPISITTLPGSDIVKFSAGGEDIRLLSSRVPGLNVESSNGRVAPRFYIRGLGNTDFDLAASQPVSVIMDDVVMENVILKSFPLFDIGGVEVLRGPQGTLFGRNTPAGIVKIETRKPTEEAEGYVSASYGSYGTTSVEAAAGGPLGEKIMYRASALYQRRNDWVDNGFTNKDNVMGGYVEAAGRLQVLFKPTDSFEALANIHIRSLDSTATLFRANILTAGSSDINDNFHRGTVYYNEGNDNPLSYDSWGTSLKLSYELPNGLMITSITGYEETKGSGEGDIDGGNPEGPGVIPFQSHSKDSMEDLYQLTEEFRISQQATEDLFYQAGFYYFKSDFTVKTEPFFTNYSTVRHKNESWALFGQVAYNFDPKTTLTVGARYTEDDKTADAVSGYLDFGFEGNFVSLDQVKTSGNKFTWDAAVNHTISDDLSVYARVATGFRAPTIQGRDVAFGTGLSKAKSETIISYEAGFKAELIENRLRWNGAVYYYDVSNLQVTAVGGASNSTQLISLDEVIGMGFETDIEFLATENLKLTLGFSYTDTEIHDDEARVAPCGTGMCTPLNESDSDGFVYIDNNSLPQAPSYTLNFAAEYTFPVDDGAEFFASTDWAVQGKTWLLLYQTAEYQSSGTFEGGLRAGYRWGDGKYEAAIFGRNITNEANLKGGLDFDNLTGFVNEPRVIGVSFGANF